MDYNQKLNDTFLELLSDLINVFPEDADFRLYLATSRTALRIDNSLVYEAFKAKIAQYEQQILAKDENFMINLDIEREVNAETEDAREYLSTIVSKLRTTWDTLDVKDKDVVWKYWRTMLLLYKKVANRT